MEAIAIRDLVVDADALAQSAQGAGEKKRSDVSFEVVAASAADFAVRRRCGKSSRLLACIVSQGQFYVKDERTGKIKPLDEGALTSFLRGSGGTVAVGAPWVAALKSDGDFKRRFLRAIGRPDFKALAQSGVWTVDGRGCTDVSETGIVAFVGEHPALAKTLRALSAQADDEQRYALARLLPLYSWLDGKFGLDRARAFLARFAEAGFPWVYYHNDFFTGAVRKVFEEVPEMNFGRFLAYLFDESRHQGFYCSRTRYGLDDWVDCWADTLRMQRQLLGKVAHRYPEHLLSYHQVLSAECALRQEEIDERQWQEAVEAMSHYRWEGGGYLVVCPESPSDMRAEAVAQGNCLASYIGRVQDGRDWIFFLRQASSPETSYVTVEVSPTTKRIVQAKARSNRTPDAKALEALRAWAKAVGLKAGVAAS